jgi:hypothetical protein
VRREALMDTNTAIIVVVIVGAVLMTGAYLMFRR